MSWKVLGKHKWVVGAVITESVDDADLRRRFTATVLGYRNWKIFEGRITSSNELNLIARVVRAIRDQIDEDGEDCEAFEAANEYGHDAAELVDRAELFEHPSWVSVEEAFDMFLEAGKVYLDPARQGTEEQHEMQALW